MVLIWSVGYGGAIMPSRGWRPELAPGNIGESTIGLGELRIAEHERGNCGIWGRSIPPIEFFKSQFPACFSNSAIRSPHPQFPHLFILAGHFKKSKDEAVAVFGKNLWNRDQLSFYRQCYQGTLTPQSGVTDGHFISRVCRLVFPRCGRGEETAIAILGLFCKFPSSYPAGWITPTDGSRKEPRSPSRLQIVQWLL